MTITRNKEYIEYWLTLQGISKKQVKRDLHITEPGHCYHCGQSCTVTNNYAGFFEPFLRGKNNSKHVITLLRSYGIPEWLL